MTDPVAAQTAAQAAGEGEVESAALTCPAPCVVTVLTRTGDIPVEGVYVEGDGVRVGVTNSNGIAMGSVSTCDGAVTLKAIYENADARVKTEEATLEVTGLSLPLTSATAGQARNFIAKVQDVFGSGDGGFPGDKDFEDTYTADATQVTVVAGTLHVTIKLATISLEVPYRNQNDSAETIGNVAQRGAILCMPTSGEMQGRYWGIQKVTAATATTPETRADITRYDIMMEAYNRNTTGYQLGVFPRHWQNWDNLRGAMTTLVDASHPNTYSVGNGPAGGSVETIPSAYADSLTELLGEGVPTVTSTYATDGHVMIVIGAVVKHDDESEWLILNDPNGTLASTDSIYGDLDIQNPVGARGTSTAAVMNSAPDVRAVQEVLTRTGHYTGPTNGVINEADPNDPTIAAIRAFQGRGGDGRVDPGGGAERRMNAQIDRGTSPKYSAVENERNGPAGDRGRHVYYNGGTEGARAGNFRLKGQAWSSVIEPDTALTTAEIADRLNTGTRR
ncbi:hypothetical protein [Litoreibacter arenae]|uniref:Uncharacterized protein n=1 Tax=Litoreibacter arenae DSM 19593 TaxID=1123360 RepID=S9Q7S6_9RHOB|nr:hypothetical protein [Litoreibacter arenae]EPX77431.1 hypothetical protein thalar_03154 [Litoreibacter arenae DSM 19593]